MSRNKRICFSLLLGILLSLTACQKAAPASAEPVFAPPEEGNYKTAQVERGDYIQKTTAAGSLFFPVSTDLYAERPNLRLKKFLVSEKQEVKKGDVLAEFTSEESEAALLAKELAYKEGAAALERGKRSRMEAIEQAKKDMQYTYSNERALRELEIKKMESQYQQYVFSAERDQRLLQDEIQNRKAEQISTQIVAPYDGCIDKLTYLNPGDQVQQGDLLITMYSTDRVLVRVDNSSRRFRYNMPVTVEAGPKNNRSSYPGTVVAAADSLPAGQDSGTAYIELDQSVPAEDLENNLTVTGNTVELLDVLIAKQAAQTLSEGKSYVNILENGLVHKRYIIMGAWDAGVFWILDGLKEGQILVLN